MKKKYVELQNGTRYEITEEKDRYYICGKTAFRKANPTIRIVEEEPKKPRKKKEEPETETELAVETPLEIKSVSKFSKAELKNEEVEYDIANANKKSKAKSEIIEVTTEKVIAEEKADESEE